MNCFTKTFSGNVLLLSTVNDSTILRLLVLRCVFSVVYRATWKLIPPSTYIIYSYLRRRSHLSIHSFILFITVHLARVFSLIFIIHHHSSHWSFIYRHIIFIFLTDFRRVQYNLQTQILLAYSYLNTSSYSVRRQGTFNITCGAWA